MQSLATARLVLRPLTLRDADFVLAVLNDPAFIRFIGDRHVRTREQAQEYISHGPVRDYKDLGHGMLLAEMKADATPIGLCGLLKREYLPDADIGFAFLPAYRSQGFALEAATAVIDHAFATLALPRILAVVQPDNVASRQLLQKLGMHVDRAFKIAANQSELLLLARTCEALSLPP